VDLVALDAALSRLAELDPDRANWSNCLTECGSGSSPKPAGPGNVVAAGTYHLTISAATGNQATVEVLTLTVK
jgi:hypothetical protein